MSTQRTISPAQLAERADHVAFCQKVGFLSEPVASAHFLNVSVEDARAAYVCGEVFARDGSRVVQVISNTALWDDEHLLQFCVRAPVERLPRDGHSKSSGNQQGMLSELIEQLKEVLEREGDIPARIEVANTDGPTVTYTMEPIGEFSVDDRPGVGKSVALLI